MQRDELDRKLQNNMNESCFIDGLQNQVCIRIKALPEIMQYIDSLEQSDDVLHPIYSIANLFSRIKSLIDLNTSDSNTLNNEEKERLKFYHEELLYDDKKRHLPISVYSYARPMSATQFILHLLLSLGHFVTEVDLLLHVTIIESLRQAKLICPSDDLELLQQYSDELLK